MKCAYMTLATTSRYLEGAKQLYLSYLDTNSIYPFYVVVLNETDISGYEDLPIIRVEKIYPKINYQGYVFIPSMDIFTKFQLWSFTQFDKILFLDADCVMHQNNDYIFNNIIQEYLVGVNGCDRNRLNASVFLLRPSLYFFELLINQLNSHERTKDDTFYEEFVFGELLYKYPKQVALKQVNHSIIHWRIQFSDIRCLNQSIYFIEEHGNKVFKKYWELGYSYKDVIELQKNSPV